MYYYLKENCFLIEGACRGAIYNLDSGKVFSINRGAIELLKACENTEFTKLIDVDAEDSRPSLTFLDTLTTKGLGAFYTSVQATPKPAIPEYQPSLEYVWLEITSKCNNRCLHCYSASSPEVTAGCVPHSRWLNLISEARAEGAHTLQLIGGEPLLYPKWRELVIKAREEKYDLIEIFTNATLIDDDCIKFFKEYDVSLATTLYADNAAIHDKVTLHKGSFEKTLNAINKIIDNNLPLRIASIIMKANENEAENIMKLCTKLGVEVTPPDIVRPTGRGDDKELLPTAYTKQPIKPPFFTDIESFAKNRHYHSCLAGRLAITADGDVIPCIFARNQICGNIIDMPLHSVLTNQALKTCWQTTKDCIIKCRSCEYRYACPDCRPLSQNSDSQKNWYASPVDCSYNPFIGKWENVK